MPWYRCVFEDSDRTITLTIDVLCDADGVADRGLTFYGYYRDNNENENSPLALTYDGKIDWGDESKWVSTIKLHGAKIRPVGTSFPYAAYETNAALLRNDPNWSAPLILKSYKDYAE